MGKAPSKGVAQHSGSILHPVQATGTPPLSRAAGGALAGAFVPAVLGLALATPIYWSERVPFGEALPHGLAVLVVACPCALGLAVPLATSIGIGSLARRGCLARGGDVLESIALTRTIAFDKTSTLTLGEPLMAGSSLVVVLIRFGWNGFRWIRCWLRLVQWQKMEPDNCQKVLITKGRNARRDLASFTGTRQAGNGIGALAEAAGIFAQLF